MLAMRQSPIDRFSVPFKEFLRDQSTGGALLFLMALVAMVWANSPWKESYHHLWEHTISISVDQWKLERTLHHWINDGLMALFFFLVGLELKREVVRGELSQSRNAILPVAAGIGGMIVPALIFLMFNPSGPAHAGWGIPMATDIAFAMGLMALLGRRVPVALKVFITTLAIADDLGAVLVIAIFYTSDISLINLEIGAGFMIMLLAGNLLGVRNPWYYAVIGIGGMWTAFMLSGIHATVAGVLAAFAIPAVTKLDERTYIDRITVYVREFAALRPNKLPTLTEEQLHMIEKIEDASESAETPLQRLESNLRPLVMFVVMPLFALANAGVELPHDLGSALTGTVTIGVGLGLLLGKPIGILLMCWLLVRMGWARIGPLFTWQHLIGAAFMAGVGFTMSLFVNELAFKDTDLQQEAKLGILLASFVSGGLGYMWLRRQAPIVEANDPQ
ncbi:MAG: Na+/H+ antiporter NhaA [Flavobacteriales bacterium]|nr:Na+/H+ antiporter NhaA [Flavobacteriales bacterium]